MMEDLMNRGEELARDRQRRRLQGIARQMRAILGSAAVQIDETRVLARGRGMIRRWLLDPRLRFLSGWLG
jgi:hypothetical protein